jgi:hypothetical protein
MLLFNEVKPYIENEINKLNEYIDKSNISGFYYIHGTFQDGEIKKLKYISDIDAECWIKYNNNLNDIYLYIVNFITYITDNNYYFGSFLTGYDDRFVFNFKIKKNGDIIDYDTLEIKTNLKKLLDNKTLNENEYNTLINNVKNNPTLIDIQKLILILEEYQLISWSLDDIKKGWKIQRGQKFILKDQILSKVIMTSFVLEYTKNNFCTFELNFHIYTIDKKYKNTVENIERYGKFYGEYDRTTNIMYYEGIFKNYAQKKYLKVFKRLRSLLTSFILYNDDRKTIGINTSINTVNTTTEKIKDQKYFKFIKRIRYEMREIMFNNQIACLNQIKSRIDNIIILMEYKKPLEIKKLVIELLKDTITYCNFKSNEIDNIHNILKNKYNENLLQNSLNKFKKEVFAEANNLILPDLIKYYNLLAPLLPLKLVLPLPE